MITTEQKGELEDFITKMLDHIDNHKEVYKKWSNRDIAKAWINCSPNFKRKPKLQRR